MKRPAESAGIAGTIGLLIARVAGVHDVDTVTVIGAAVGAVPALVTFLVANGGVRGVARLVWKGRGR